MNESENNIEDGIQMPVDLNPRPNQRQRTVFEPFDSLLTSHLIFTHPLFNEISLGALEHDKAIENNLNFKYIDLMILRLITSSQVSANVYSKKKGQAMNHNQMKFSRLILCKVVSSYTEEENARVVYLMEARNQNKNLWNKNVNHRDNGSISIGSIIRLPCPMPINTYMRCDIPLIVSYQPAILLKFPSTIRSIPMNIEIESNTSSAFVYNSTDIEINFTTAVKTSCSGNLCDRQRISDWNGIKGCGCYGMPPNSTSLAIQHAISISTINSESFRMDDFSSRKFSSLYLTDVIPGSVKLYMLQITNAYIEIIESITNCVNLINENGGFTVIGWYKKGLINDKSMIAAKHTGVGTVSGSNNNNTNVDEDIQVESGEISYHIVHIIPTNKDFLDPNTRLGLRLKGKKFDVSTIENSS